MISSASASTATCKYCGSQSQKGPYCCTACQILDSRLGVMPILEEGSNPFAYMDTDEFRDLYKRKASWFDYIFYAEGMHCSSCVHLLEKLPEYYPEIESARVHFPSSTVAVKLKPAASLAQIAHVITELGYKPTLLAAGESTETSTQSENKSYLKRIAVAGFCAGNTMLFVIPVYAGLAGGLADLFNWMSFVLFLPILFYSAVPFYKGAWNALRFGSLSVDLPITAAMLAGFVFSTMNLIRGNGAIYFDSTASFLFLILSARYLLKRLQQKSLSTSQANTLLHSTQYTKIQGDQFRQVPFSTLQKGDEIEVAPGQTLPGDGTLLSTGALIDMSLFNGESLPKRHTIGMRIPAGTKVLAQPIRIKIEKTFAQSDLGRMLQDLDRGALEKSRFISLTDRMAQILISVVFFTAALFFAVYLIFGGETSEAFNRSLALLVLACPCALAFGSPLTFGMALRRAQQMGIMIKDATSLERILKVKNIFFDKTGTLTTGSLQYSHSEPSTLSDRLVRIILSLESCSHHPIAFSLREALPNNHELFKVESLQETLGIGVSGVIEGKLYELRSLAESTHEAQIAVELRENGECLCRLYFSDPLRETSAKALQVLRRRGLELFILSGDKKHRVWQVSDQVGIPRTHSYGELFPEDKKKILSQYAQTCMIGDGANDSLSLRSADVGIAVKGSVDLSLRSADIYFSRGGLEPLIDLVLLAQKTRVVLIRNLGLSLAYNLIGGTLALLGYIDPMLAAILMPVSSLVVIISTLWGYRK